MYWGQLQPPFAWPLRGIEQTKASLGFRAILRDKICFDTQSERDELRCDKEQMKAKARNKHGHLRELLKCALPLDQLLLPCPAEGMGRELGCVSLLCESEFCHREPLLPPCSFIAIFMFSNFPSVT